MRSAARRVYIGELIQVVYSWLCPQRTAGAEWSTADVLFAAEVFGSLPQTHVAHAHALGPRNMCIYTQGHMQLYDV